MPDPPSVQLRERAQVPALAVCTMCHKDVQLVIPTNLGQICPGCLDLHRNP